MTLTPAEMDRKIDEHFGFEARDDVKGVLSTLTPDVLHDVVGWPTGPPGGARRPSRSPTLLRHAQRTMTYAAGGARDQPGRQPDPHRREAPATVRPCGSTTWC